MINYRQVYEEAFSDPKYNNDPGADKYQFVLKTCEQYLTSENNTMADIGCGKGYMFTHLSKIPNLFLFGIDVDNFLNADIFEKCQVYFDQVDITTDTNNKEDYFSSRTYVSKMIKPLNFTTCLDVLEHIEKDKLDDIVKWIASLAPISYITVGNHPDVINGVELHPTKEKLPFWKELLEQYFTIVRMEDREDIWYSFELQSKAWEN